MWELVRCGGGAGDQGPFCASGEDAEVESAQQAAREVREEGQSNEDEYSPVLQKNVNFQRLWPKTLVNQN